MAEQPKKPSDEELSWDDTEFDESDFVAFDPEKTDKILPPYMDILVRGNDELLPWGGTAFQMSPANFPRPGGDHRLTFDESQYSSPMPEKLNMLHKVPSFFFDHAEALEFCHEEVSKILIQLAALDLLEGMKKSRRLPWRLWGQIVQGTENRLCDIAHDCVTQFDETPPHLRPYLGRGPREFCDPKNTGKTYFSINDLPALLQSIEETLSFLRVKSAESQTQEPTPQSAQARFREAIRRFFGF